jgi:hypothetical protein
VLKQVLGSRSPQSQPRLRASSTLHRFNAYHRQPLPDMSTMILASSEETASVVEDDKCSPLSTLSSSLLPLFQTANECAVRSPCHNIFTLSGSLDQCEVKMLSHLLSVCTEKLEQYDRVAALKTAPAVLKDLGTCRQTENTHTYTRAHIQT